MIRGPSAGSALDLVIVGTRLGFEQARVRQHGEMVRIEIACHDLPRDLMLDLIITALHTSSIATNRAMTLRSYSLCDIGD